MQEQIMDLSGELDAEFEAYVSSGNAGNSTEIGCYTDLSCDTLGCTRIDCNCP